LMPSSPTFNEHAFGWTLALHPRGMTRPDVLSTLGLALQRSPLVQALRHELGGLVSALVSCAGATRTRVRLSLPCHHGEPIHLALQGDWLLLKPCATRRPVAGWRRGGRGADQRMRGPPYVQQPIREVKPVTWPTLGLRPDTSATQVIGPRSHADYVQTRRLVGTLPGGVSPTEIAQPANASDVLEWRKSFANGQKSESSADCHTSATPFAASGSAGLARCCASYTVWPALRERGPSA